MSRGAGSFPVSALALLAAGGFPFIASPSWAQSPKVTDDESLEEIIVTARRRTESLQRTPVSVVSLSEDDLVSRSVTNLRSLQNFVPNLTFAPSQNVGEGAANIFIRGIGQEDFIAGSETGVGVYMDGVYLARPMGLMFNLSDLERIEVLRGPQGTLFGKNTIGGAINIISAAPGPNAQGRLGAIVGSYDRFEVRAMLNAPLTNKVLVRLSAVGVTRDGYLRRLPPPNSLGALGPVDNRREGSDRSQGGRLQVRWLIDDTLSADFSLDGTQRRNTQSATHVDQIDPRFGIFPIVNELIRQGRLPGPEISNELARGDLLESYAGSGNIAHQESWGASATLAKDVGGGTLKLILARRGLRSHVESDVDGLYFDIVRGGFRDRQRQTSVELQYSGETGRLSYTAGLFGLRERIRTLPVQFNTINVLYRCGCYDDVDTLPPPIAVFRQLSDKNYAGYAQGTYRLTDAVSLTLGARYSYERKTIDAQVYEAGPDFRPTDVLITTAGNRDDWTSLTWRAGVEYQATRDAMLYGSISEGFKSGGFNIRPTFNLPNLGMAAYSPERARNYEIGLRSEWFGRRLRLNATLFHTDYRDIQLRQQTFVEGTTTTLIENAARARIRGAELELMARPIAGLSISAAYGHLDARYLDVGRVRGITTDSRLQRTPKHSFTTSMNYEIPIGSGTLAAHGDLSYRSKEQFQIIASPNDQGGYSLLGGRISYRTIIGWSFALFGTNLLDKRYRVAGRGTTLRDAGFINSLIGPPRQIGVEIGRSF